MCSKTWEEAHFNNREPSSRGTKARYPRFLQGSPSVAGFNRICNSNRGELSRGEVGEERIGSKRGVSPRDNKRSMKAGARDTGQRNLICSNWKMRALVCRGGATDRGNPKRRLASLRNNIDRWRPPLFSIGETRKKFDLICCNDIRGFTVSME